MKRLTLIGLLMVLMSLPIFYLNSSTLQFNFAGGGVSELVVMPASTASVTFNLSTPTAVGFDYYTNGTPINYFLVNQSESWLAASGPTQNSIGANTMKAKGTIQIIQGSAAGMFPYQQQGVQYSNVYMANFSPILPQGQYYSVFQNPSESNVIVHYTIITESQADMKNAIYSSAAEGLTGAALLFDRHFSEEGFTLPN